MTSFDDEVKYYHESQNSLSKGEFNLRTYNTNSMKLQDMSERANTLDTDKQTKVLRLKWNTNTDILMFQQNQDKIQQKGNTKPLILRESSTNFDPLGLLSRIIMKFKIFIKSLWRHNFKWNQLLPVYIEAEWRKLGWP